MTGARRALLTIVSPALLGTFLCLTPVAAQETVRASGAMLRGLDKVSGRTTDLTIAVGEAVRYGRLDIRLGECRYPAGNPSSDAFAQMTITDLRQNATVFSGWMIASSPALSALDDARYDVWVMSCDAGGDGNP